MDRCEGDSATAGAVSWKHSTGGAGRSKPWGRARLARQVRCAVMATLYTRDCRTTP